MNQEEIQPEKVPPIVKLVKLVNGEMLVAMVEEKEEGLLTLYNPFRLMFGEITMLQKSTLLMEEWLPGQVAAEQVCDILYDDVLTMVDVSPAFLKSYTKSVLRKIHLEAIAKENSNFLLPNSIDTSMEMTEEEAEELENEKIDEAIKKHKDSMN